MSDLVERLLAEQILQQDEYSTTTMRRNPDGPEAAACITELETALAEAGKQLRENAETLAQVPAALTEAATAAPKNEASLKPKFLGQGRRSC